MATAAQLRSFVGSSVSITPQQMVAKIDEVIAAAMMDPSTLEAAMPWQSVSADGVSNSRSSLADLRALRQMYIDQCSGGVVGQYVEFVGVR